MISGLVEGRGILSAGDILPVSWAFQAEAASVTPYDPAEARRLLAEAGWLSGGDGVVAKGGRRLAFTLTTDTGSQLRREIALVLRQDWQAIGAAVELELVERNTLVVERVLRGQFQAALLQSSVRVDPDLSRRFHSRSMQSGQNFLGYANPVLDSLLDRALLAPTAAARAPLYQEAQMLLARDVPQVNLFYPTVYYVVRADIGGIRPSAMGPFWNAEEWGR
jgi:peptide/nickel transport system substrate-binding protein